MTGYKQIKTKAPLIGERRFIALCEAAAFGVVFVLALAFLVEVLA